MNKISAVLIFLILMPVHLYPEGDVESLRQYEYWDNGKTRVCDIYDVNGYIRTKAMFNYDGLVDKVEKFDTDGNKVEEAFYDSKGRLKSGIDGWAAMRWWYHDSRLVSQIAYNEYGKPIEKRYYSESGRLVARQYNDSADFNPYEDANMAMLLGSNNMPYRDPVVRTEEAEGLIKK